MRIALIEWVDSSSNSGWHEPGNEDIAHCITVGVVYSENSERITLFTSKSHFGNHCDSISIPKVCIKRIRKLGVRNAG